MRIYLQINNKTKTHTMKNINNDVFYNKIMQRVKNGDFDAYLTIPFMTRDLFSKSLKGRLDKKMNTGSTPILSDAEIKDCLAETKETAANIIVTYLKCGFMVRTEDGFEFTEKVYKAIKQAYRS
jgi:predicted small metal-binding protein